MSTEAKITTIVQLIGTDIKLLKNSIGNLTELDTSAVTNVVAAINELKDFIDLLSSDPNSIDDSAGNGATDVTWSSDKIYNTIELAKVAITNTVVNGSQAALDTLKELQDALASDPNFATTVSNALGLLVRVDTTQTFDNVQKSQGRSNIGASGRTDFVALQTNIGDVDYDFANAYLLASSMLDTNRVYARLDPSRTGTQAILESSQLSLAANLYSSSISNIGKNSGKWYFEVICINASQKATIFGVVNTDTYNKDLYPGSAGNGWCYEFGNGSKYFNLSLQPYGSSPTYNQWVGCYFDADEKTVGFIHNGVDYGIAFTGLTGTLHAILGNGSSVTSGVQNVNFGDTPFAYNPPPGYNHGLY